MTTARDTFLRVVRDAVTAGNQAGQRPDLPPRGALGYAGAGADLVARFGQELQTLGGRCHVVRSNDEATRVVGQLVVNGGFRCAVVGWNELTQRLALPDLLRQLGLEVWQEPPGDAGDRPTLHQAETRAALFQAEVGITGVEWLIAETGTVVVTTRAGQGRSPSLLPPVHIAVAERNQLLPDLFDLFERLDPAALPACVTLITGPSKTGDIELRLVTGVHGPGEVHVVLIDAM